MLHVSPPKRWLPVVVDIFEVQVVVVLVHKRATRACVVSARHFGVHALPAFVLLFVAQPVVPVRVRPARFELSPRKQAFRYGVRVP